MLYLLLTPTYKLVGLGALLPCIEEQIQSHNKMIITSPACPTGNPAMGSSYPHLSYNA